MSRLTFISAGAGSGKTYALTRKLGEMLDAGTVHPGGVIATTFTRKAASELRERVRQHLLESGRFSLASAMGQARIGTVNSVCGGLLERFAFEAGLAPRQRVLEESQASLLVKEAIDAARTGEEVAALSRLADRLGIEKWPDVLGKLVEQARVNDIAPELLPGFAEENANALLARFPRPTESDLSGAILELIDTALPALRATADSSGKKVSRQYVDLLEDFARRLKAGFAPWSDWIKVSKALPEVALHRPHAVAIQAMAAQVASHPGLHADIRSYLGQMFALCAEALVHYRERKLGLGVVDFADQEHLLLKLLDKPQVQAALAQELDLLMVDEFQDTSPIQLALFIRLATLAKQTLWVGDLKQAIYGFRGSDTALMQAILQDLEKLGGKKQILDTSWRARPALVNLTNTIFTRRFAHVLAPEEVALKPQRAEFDGLPALSNWVLAGRNIPARTQALAAGVRTLLGSGHQVSDNRGGTRPLLASDVAILARTHDRVKAIAQALRQGGTPVATDQPGLLATPEAVLAMACLRRLNDPSDTVATAEIVSLADSSEPESWLSDRLAYLTTAQDDGSRWRETGENAHPIVAGLARMRARLPLLTPTEALLEVVTGCGLSGIVLGWHGNPAVGRMRLANLEALLGLAATYEDACRGTLKAATVSGLILWLEAQAEAEMDALARPGVEAVQVLTHYAAKGLEWPVVILTDLETEPKSRLWDVVSGQARGTTDALDPLRDRYLRYWPWPFGKQRAGISVADDIAAAEFGQQFEAEARDEERRLLYVSMTRPRDMLILARQADDLAGGWIADLEAPWLLSTGPDTTELKLPGGETIPCQHREWTGPEDTPQRPETQRQVSWFKALPAITREPLFRTPSSAQAGEATVLEHISVGRSIPVSGSVDWADLGTALHACIAASFTTPDQPLEEDEILSILAGFEVADAVPTQAVREQIQALQEWLNQRWPGHTPLAEAFAGCARPDGTRVNGRIDLVLDTPAGYILIDHKSSPLGPAEWGSLGRAHGGQLKFYAEAIERITGRKVLERWLFLPVAGGALRIGDITQE